MNNINLTESQDNDTIGTECNNSTVEINNLIHKATNKVAKMSEIDKLVIDSLRDKKFCVVDYIVRKNKINPLVQDINNGFTILHYLIDNYDKFTEVFPIIKMLLELPNVNDFINIQNFEHSDAPIHLATKLGHHNIVNMLIEAGADTKLSNIHDEYICTDYDPEINNDSMSNNNSLFKNSIMSSKNNNSSSINNNSLFKNNNSSFKNNNSSFKNNNSLSSDTINNDSVFISKKNDPEIKNKIENTIKNLAKWFLDDINNKTSEASLRMTDAFNTDLSMQNDTCGTETFINNIIKQYDDSDIAEQFLSNKVLDNDLNNENSKKSNDELILQFIPDKMSSNCRNNLNRSNNENSKKSKNECNYIIKGGANNIKSSRKMKTMSDYDTEDYDKFNMTTDSHVMNQSDQLYHSSYRPSQKRADQNNEAKQQIYRLIQNQSDRIHDRTVEKIMQLLNVDEQKAKVYKAALYDEIYRKRPELNDLDRAVELEKRATTDNLKRIDYDKWVKIANKS